MVPPTAFPGPQPPGPPPGASYGGGGFAVGPPGGFAAGPPGGVGSQAQAPLPGGRKGAGPNGEARYACEIGGARSVAQVGMDGLKVFDGSGQRCLHVYPLDTIMKWSTPGATQLLCRVKSSGGSEVEVKLEARADTVQEMLDSLTAACMQVQEMIDHKASGGGGAGGGAHSRAQPLTHGRQGLGELGREIEAAEGQRKSWFGRSAAPASQTSGQVAVPSAVIFWHNPTHDGWLHSQGDHTKSWRRRWFVIKSGWLMRFIDDKVTMDTKARGAYDLSRCSSVSIPSPFDTEKQLAKPGTATLQLNMAGGTEVLLAADSEVERDLWREVLSRALKDLQEGSSADPGGARASAAGRSSGASVPGGNGGAGAGNLMRQLQQGYSSHVAQGGGRPNASRDGAITVVGYEGAGGYGSNSPSAPGFGHAPPPGPPPVANWQVCYTQEGQVYYHDPATGRVQWEAP